MGIVWVVLQNAVEEAVTDPEADPTVGAMETVSGRVVDRRVKVGGGTAYVLVCTCHDDNGSRMTAWSGHDMGLCSREMINFVGSSWFTSRTTPNWPFQRQLTRTAFAQTFFTQLGKFPFQPWAAKATVFRLHIKRKELDSFRCSGSGTARYTPYLRAQNTL